MSRYIDRAELFNNLANAKTVEEIFAAIQAAPAADVQEVRKGWWVYNQNFAEPPFKCSACGKAFARLTPYCAECGAKMGEVGA